jgi:hypothetical protein
VIRRLQPVSYHTEAGVLFLIDIEISSIDEMLKPENLKVEVVNESGEWEVGKL